MIITLNKQRFARTLSAMLIAAADDAERPNVACVQFWQHGDRFSMASTTGHWAVLFAEVVGTEGETERIAIARHDAEFLAGILALDKPLDPEMAEDEEIELELGPGVAIECDRYTVRLQASGADAPDIEVLVKGTERGTLPCVTLDPSILADVRKVFKTAGKLAKGDEELEFGFGPSMMHPVLITCPAVVDLACIVMPRKPRDVDMKEDGETRRYVRRDTGEVVHSEPVSKQTCISGTESDPMAQSIEALQAAADATGEVLAVHTDAGTATIKPRKRGKKAEVQS